MRRRMWLVVLAVSVMFGLGVGPALAVVGPGKGSPVARGCVAGPSTPGWFLDASGPNEYEVAAGSTKCSYLASASGGYEAPAGAFSLRVERKGSVKVYGPAAGPCRDDVVRPGDRVTLVAEIAAAVGADNGCRS